jgi:hypothetical protein
MKDPNQDHSPQELRPTQVLWGCQAVGEGLAGASLVTVSTYRCDGCFLLSRLYE